MRNPAASGNTGAFAAFEWLLAFRYLRARRRKGSVSVIAVFSVIGIALGVAALIMVLSVMNGFRKELFDKILGLKGHAIVKALDRKFTDFDETAQRFRAVPGVKSAFAVIEGQAMISSQAGSSGLVVRALREQDLTALKPVTAGIRYGSLEGFDDGGGIAIGTRLANTLNVFVGSDVAVLSPRGAQTAFGTVPRQKHYTVKAIFEMGPEYDNSIAFMPLKEAQVFFNLKGAVQSLEVMLGNPDDVDQMLGALKEAGGPSVVLSDWRQREATFYNALTVERNVMFIIVMLVVLVATLNIISGLAMLVKNKARDIAVLRTMGATRGAVMRVFFISGTAIGALGTVTGFAIGVLASLYWIHFLSGLPSELDTKEAAVVVAVSLLLSMMATIYPARQAARLDPVLALRYE